MRSARLRRRLPGGLFWRTFMLIGALILASLLAWTLIFRAFERTPRAQQIAWQVSSIVNLTRAALVSAHPERRRELLADLAANERVRVTVLEPTDRIEPLEPGRMAYAVAERLQVLLGPATRFASAVDGRPGFWISFDIAGDDYWLVFDRSRVERNTGPSWAGWTLVALGLALAGAFATSRLVNRPLADLARALRELARGGRAPPLPETGPSEIARLNGQFNRMADALATLEADRALALAGISHDVRTPLTRLRMEIELAALPEDTRAAMAEDIAAIDRIVGQFVEFARGGAPEAPVQVPVSRQLAALRARHGADIAAGILRWHDQAQPEASWLGRPADFERVAANLIENARRYGATPGTGVVELRVALARRGAGIELTVEDRGPGVPAGQLDRLARPFARLDAARGAPGASGGSGLGLAIVERLAARYAGRMRLSLPASGGLRVQVELPDAAGEAGVGTPIASSVHSRRPEHIMQSASLSSSPPSSVDALQLLREDHRRVARLFDEFESLQREQTPDRQRLVQLVQDIGAELTLHAQLEEEVFYPAVEQATGERQFVEHARTEHQHARDLMRALAGMQIDDPQLPATVRDLAGAVTQHVREEEENLFPHAQSRLDVQAVGQQLAQRRQQLESPSGDGPVENDGDMGVR